MVYPPSQLRRRQETRKLRLTSEEVRFVLEHPVRKAAVVKVAMNVDEASAPAQRQEDDEASLDAPLAVDVGTDYDNSPRQCSCLRHNEVARHYGGVEWYHHVSDDARATLAPTSSVSSTTPTGHKRKGRNIKGGSTYGLPDEILTIRADADSPLWEYVRLRRARRAKSPLNAVSHSGWTPFEA
ncbi:MAG: hypothetical protein M1816_007704 [Peltula sp. TS41687]|nr:MAG: hypothetical protein M1816_007704 [Peltula sp. TS41687]